MALMTKEFKKKATKKVSVPFWAVLGFIVISILLLGFMVQAAIVSERDAAVQKYKVAQEKKALMERDLPDLKEWAAKNFIIMGVYGAPVAAVILAVVLLIHGFKVVGR